VIQRVIAFGIHAAERTTDSKVCGVTPESTNCSSPRLNLAGSQATRSALSEPSFGLKVKKSFYFCHILVGDLFTISENNVYPVPGNSVQRNTPLGSRQTRNSEMSHTRFDDCFISKNDAYWVVHFLLIIPEGNGSVPNGSDSVQL
jgi:hypothetical protein